MTTRASSVDVTYLIDKLWIGCRLSSGVELCEALDN
jgi:hypothetical protein